MRSIDQRIKDWARRVFRHDNMTTYEIAEIAGCSQSAVFRWVNKEADKRYKQWADNNREATIAIGRRHRGNNLEECRAKDREHTAHRRAMKRIEYSDLTLSERSKVQQFYRDCPEGYEVDHILPLTKGGLHLIENLQYLPAHLNRKKSNRILSNDELIQRYG